MNLESNDPHEQIERNIREQINIISDNVADLENLCKGEYVVVDETFRDPKLLTTL